MRISPSPLFEKTTKSFPVFIFYLLLSVLLIAIDVRLHILDLARENVKGFFLPVTISTKNLIKITREFLLPHLQIEQINSQYQELLEQKFKLLEQIDNLQGLETENKNLRQANNLNKRQDLKLEMAELIDYQQLDHIILINKGSRDGIHIAQPVINYKGLVGQVVKVYKDYSEVNLITAVGSKVPVIIKNQTRNDLYATLVGKGTDLVELHHQPQNYLVQIGDQLVTSSLAKAHYSDYLAAEVTQIEAVPNLIGIRVLAKPVVDPNELDFVAVVTNNNEFSQKLQALIQ